MKRYDVSIVGSGPAAISAAIVLAQRNVTVVVFHKDEREPTKRTFGETLSHSVAPSLTELGVASLFRKLKMRSIAGSVSSWGSSQPERTSGVLHPLGISWSLSKEAFIRILVERATALGATFCLDPVERVDRRKGVWEIDCEAKSTVSAELMIVATGRDGPGFAKLPRKVPLDKLVACIASFEDIRGERPNLVRLDASENGWFFSVKSDEKTRVLSYFTDGDLLGIRDQRRFLRMLNHELPKLPSISKTIKQIDPSRLNSFCVVSANSTFRESFFSKGLFFCGDSAQTFDPLSSQGISAAIQDAIEVANIIAGLDSGSKELVIEHQQRRKKRYLEYLRTWHNIYCTEKRWTENVFWHRRHSLQYLKTFVNTVCGQRS